jgi:hypothetical protein
MQYQVAWYNRRPYCWVASVDGGKTWEKLKADNDEDSSEAIEEASKRFGPDTNKWELLDDPILSLGN